MVRDLDALNITLVEEVHDALVMRHGDVLTIHINTLRNQLIKGITS